LPLRAALLPPLRLRFQGCTAARAEPREHQPARRIERIA
jgi:hypothetical protein